MIFDLPATSDMKKSVLPIYPAYSEKNIDTFYTYPKILTHSLYNLIKCVKGIDWIRSYNMGLDARKPSSGGVRPTKAQTSLGIRAD